MPIKRIIIIGAAGRDFHNFNVVYRNNDHYRVVAFTAAQIPNIADRIYPPALAGKLYPKGIPIFPEANLPALIHQLDVDECIFSYSDVSNQKVMETSAIVNAAGADFILLGPRQTQLKLKKPVIAVGAVRTGCGKSQTTRNIIEYLMTKGIKVISVRHPMPYGDLASQRLQRFETLEDLDAHQCTVEELEEYEPHVVRGNVIYAGVDYNAIAAAAQNDPKGCDVIVWDGGNNDFPFYKPDLLVAVTDPHRPGHELSFYPGTTTLRMAHAVIINKVDSAEKQDVKTVLHNITTVNPDADIILCASEVNVTHSDRVRGKRVLVIEDGPTLTHGQMKIGAGVIAARKYGASEIVDPRPFAVGSLADVYNNYPEIGPVLPAMGYSPSQLKDLQATIAKTECDVVVIGTPVDLNRIIPTDKPCVRVTYELKEIENSRLTKLLDAFAKKHRLS